MHIWKIGGAFVPVFASQASASSIELLFVRTRASLKHMHGLYIRNIEVVRTRARCYL
jgi:hypothetical protein